MEDKEKYFEDDELIIKKENQYWIVEPKIRMDLSYAENFFTHLMEHLKNDINHVLIDMSSVPYISSSGIKVLLKIKNFLEIRGYKIVLYSLSKEVHKIIHISELHHLLPIFNTFDEVIEYLNK